MAAQEHRERREDIAGAALGTLSAQKNVELHIGSAGNFAQHLFSGVRLEVKLSFPLEVALHFFKNIVIKYGGGDDGPRDAIVSALKEDTIKILEGMDVLRTMELKTARDELQEVFDLLERAFKERSLTEGERARVLYLARRVKNKANKAFNAVPTREQKVDAVKMAVTAIAVAASLEKQFKPDVLATQFQSQVDKLLNDDAVRNAIETLRSGGIFTFNNEDRRAFLRDVLTVVSQEIFFLRRYKLDRGRRRPLLGTDDDVHDLERQCCGGAIDHLSGDKLCFLRKVGSSDISHIVDLLKNVKLRPVRTLTLHRSSVGYQGASKLAAALEKNSTLTTLKLGNNTIGPEGASKLAVALEKNSALMTLCLTNNHIGDEGASKLAAALEKNSTLTTLHLLLSNIGDEGASKLAVALEKNSALTTLSLWGNNIGPDGASKLAAALEKNSTLKNLFLERNNIGGEGASKLAAALEKNSTLKNLFLTHNNIGDEGAAKLAAALEKNSTLTALSLWAPVSRDDRAALQRKFQRQEPQCALWWWIVVFCFAMVPGLLYLSSSDGFALVSRSPT